MISRPPPGRQRRLRVGRQTLDGARQSCHALCVCSPARKLALAGFSILIKVPPPEFRQGLSSSGYLYASTHPSSSTHSFDFRALRFAVPQAVSGGQAVFRPEPRCGGYRTRRLSRATGGSPCGKPAALHSSERHRVLVGPLWHPDWLSQERDATSIITITIPIRVRRGRSGFEHRVLGAVVRPADFDRRRWNHGGRQLDVARRRSPADNRSRRASSSANRAARRDSPPGGAPTRTAWRRPAFKARSTTRKLIGELLVVSCQ